MGDINKISQAFEPALGAGSSTVGLSVTASSTRVKLPLPPTLNGVLDAPRQVAILNIGTLPVFVAFGDATVVATIPSGATPGGYPVDPLNTYAGRPTIITIPAGVTYMAGIAASAGPTQVYVTPGNGR